MRVLPRRHRVVEVLEARLLELADRVEDGVLGQARLLGESGEDGLALLLVAPVRHREEAVRPVRVDGPLVAVRHAAVRGHDPARLVDPVLVDDPHAHAVLHEAGLAVVEDRGEAAHAAVGEHLEARLEHLVGRQALRLGDRGERLGHGRQVGLQRAHHGDLALRGRTARRLLDGRGADLLRGGIAAADHVEVDADLEEADRRQRADRLDLAELAEQLDRLLEADARVGRDGEREPQVEHVLALVVVRDARVRAEDVGRELLLALRRARGHEARAVAQAARVEDPRDLPHDALAAQVADTLEDLVLGHPDLVGERRPGPRDERQLVLEPVEQPAVGVVHDCSVTALAPRVKRDPAAGNPW